MQMPTETVTPFLLSERPPMSVESSLPSRQPAAETLLRDLGQSGASGVLEISHPTGDVSHVWVREGRIYAMQVPGYRPALGIRLLSGGLISPEQLSTAALEQRQRRPGQLIGEVLVAMGFVSPEIIEAFIREQVLDQVTDLLTLEVVGAEFHEGRHLSQGIAEPAETDALLAVAAECRDRRREVLDYVGGPGAVPVLGPPTSGPTQTPLGPYDWALLCRVDGTRDVTELARVCGFTVVEAAQIVGDLVLTGLLALPDPDPGDEQNLASVLTLRPGSEPEDPQWRFVGTDAGEPDPVARPGEAPAAVPVNRELMAEFGALLRDDPQPEQVEAVEAVETSEAGEELEEQGTEAPAPMPTPLSVVAPPAAEQPLVLVHAQAPAQLTLVQDSPRPALSVVAPQAAEPVGQEDGSGADNQSDTSAFMRELSSLSDDPDRAEPIVTRLVVPLTDHRRKRRPWSR